MRAHIPRMDFVQPSRSPVNGAACRAHLWGQILQSSISNSSSDALMRPDTSAAFRKREGVLRRRGYAQPVARVLDCKI